MKVEGVEEPKVGGVEGWRSQKRWSTPKEVERWRTQRLEGWMSQRLEDATVGGSKGWRTQRLEDPKAAEMENPEVEDPKVGGVEEPKVGGPK